MLLLLIGWEGRLLLRIQFIWLIQIKSPLMYKRYFEQKKAVFFDLDGTLADTETLWYDAFNNVLTSIGYE